MAALPAPVAVSSAPDEEALAATEAARTAPVGVWVPPIDASTSSSGCAVDALATALADLGALGAAPQPPMAFFGVGRALGGGAGVSGEADGSVAAALVPCGTCGTAVPAANLRLHAVRCRRQLSKL